MTTKKISIKFKHLKSAYSLDLYIGIHTHIYVLQNRVREKKYIFASLKTYKRIESTMPLTEVIDKSVTRPCILMIEQIK